MPDEINNSSEKGGDRALAGTEKFLGLAAGRRISERAYSVAGSPDTIKRRRPFFHSRVLHFPLLERTRTAPL